MNICLIPSTFLPLIGGMEIAVHNLASALAGLGHNVYILVAYNKKLKIKKNKKYKVIRFGFRGYGRFHLTTIAAVITLFYIVKRFKIDVVHVHNIYRPGSWAYYYNLIDKSIPVVGTPHGDDIQINYEILDGKRLNPKIDKIVKRNILNFTCVTAISQSLRNDISKLISDSSKIFDVPNGVWIKKFGKKIETSTIRERYKIPIDSIVIISVGRNHPRKGFEFGVEALSQLINAGYTICYLLVGRSMDPIINQAKILNISNYLITPGQVDENSIIELLHASDIYLSPSIVESFGIATLEAMCAGLPCVVTDIAGSRDLVSSEFGCLVKPKDIESMSNAIKFLIDNPAKRKEMGSKALIEAQKYDWHNIAKMYLKVYNTALKINMF